MRGPQPVRGVGEAPAHLPLGFEVSFERLDGRFRRFRDLTLPLLQVPLQPVDAAQGVLEREVLAGGQLLGPSVRGFDLLDAALQQVVAVRDLTVLALQLPLQARYLALEALPAAPAATNLLFEVPDALLEPRALALQGLDVPLPRLLRGACLVRGEAGGGDLLVELPDAVVLHPEPGPQFLGVRDLRSCNSTSVVSAARSNPSSPGCLPSASCPSTVAYPSSLLRLRSSVASATSAEPQGPPAVRVLTRLAGFAGGPALGLYLLPLLGRHLLRLLAGSSGFPSCLPSVPRVVWVGPRSR